MARLTFLFVSLTDPLLADLAWQIRREGHEVRYYIDSETEDDIADRWVETDGGRLQAWGYLAPASASQ